MYGQQNYPPQFRQPPPGNQPPYQQGPPPPPFQQGPPPPPPPLNHEGHPAAPRLPTYQHGLPPPPAPLQQGGPPQPSQPYLHPSPGYMNSSMTQSSANPQQNGHFPSPMPPRVMHAGPSNQETYRPPFLPRVFPPPPSQGQMLYMTPRHPQPPSIGQGIQHGQLLPPPPPSNFVSMIPPPFVSIPQAPSMPPPPPPPPPSSPPPLPPPPPSASSPPPLPPPSPSSNSPLHLPPPPPSASSQEIVTTLTSSVVHIGDSSLSSQHLLSGSSTNRIFDSLKSGLDSVDKGIGQGRTSGYLPLTGDYSTNDTGHQGDMSMVEDLTSSETQPASTPPPKPSDNATVRQIEVLCQYIAKNGSDFEVTARRKENGNPKFAFLFGGEPGSEAAVAHDYFQWMKRKCVMELKLHNRSSSEHNRSPSRLPGVESPSRGTNDDACQSLADSDMDMEDDTQDFNKDQPVDGSVHVSKESVSLYTEFVNVKEQPSGSKCTRDHQLADNNLSNLDSSHGTPDLAKTETEYDQMPFRSSTGASECNLAVTAQKSVPVEDSTSRKASSAAASGNNYGTQDPVSEIGSPFRLIQNYASDDSGESDDGESFEAVSPENASPSTTALDSSLNEQKGAKVELSTASIVTPISEKGLSLLTESDFSCPVDMASRMENLPTQSPELVDTTVVTSDMPNAFVKGDEIHDDSHEDQTPHCLGNEDSIRGNGDVESESGKSPKGGEKQGSAALKVDEFGRIVREGVSDSDSDRERRSERRYRRDRSRSPSDRRRRSRSPRRRNEKRNRSRSWSPRKRRSMGKSRSPPAFRHMGEFSGGKMRRDRDQPQVCFDFQKGRCYRGASCCYVHHGSGGGDTARHSRGRQLQHLEASKDSKKSATHEESHSSVETSDANTVPPRSEHDSLARDGVTAEVPCTDTAVSNIDVSIEGPCIDMVVSSIDMRKDGDLNVKTEAGLSVDDAQPVTTTEVGQSATAFTTKVGHSDSQGAAEQEFENQSVQQVVETAVQDEEFSEMPNEGVTRDIDASVPLTEPSLSELVVNQQLEANISHSEDTETNASAPPAERPIPAQIVTTPLPLPPDSSASQHSAHRDLHSPHFPAENYKFQHSQLPPPPPISSTQVSVSAERYAPYQTSVNDQYSQSSAPSRPSWTSLPPPPPYVQGSTSTAPSHTQGFHPMHFQPNPTPLMRPYQYGLPTPSQATEFRPPTGELHRPPFHPEGIPNQSFEFHKVSGDQHFLRSSMYDGNRFHPGPLQSPMHLPLQLREEHRFTGQVHDGIRNFPTLPNQRFTGFMTQDRHSQAPFLNEGAVNQGTPFPDGNSNLSSFSKEYGSSTINSFTQQHQPTYGVHLSGSTSFPPHLASSENVALSTRRYPFSFDGESKLSHLSVAGGSRIPPHYNPFASTFENTPGSSTYNPDSKQDSLTNPISRYDSLSLNSVSPLDSNRSRGQFMPKSGDPYDPLFDSIEPSSKALRSSEHVEGGNLTRDTISKPVVQPITDSSMVTKSNYLHGSYKMEGKEEIVGRNAGIIASPENDEFGETAIDADVGAVESESPDNDIAEKGTGDVEIDQVPSKGKSKKSKDSRSMKLFKVALADFVKDVLKPSWRQGNMSKEAFKTIVKKTVEKVAGAMKSHQIPKGQAKINQYVESSQRKLTKLVMGYVDKYVKA